MYLGICAYDANIFQMLRHPEDLLDCLVVGGTSSRADGEYFITVSNVKLSNISSRSVNVAEP